MLIGTRTFGVPNGSLASPKEKEKDHEFAMAGALCIHVFAHAFDGGTGSNAL
jgi:hypothetical protein